MIVKEFIISKVAGHNLVNYFSGTPALSFPLGSPGAPPQESLENLTFLDGLKFQQLDLAIISNDYKTISRFDLKVSNLEFRNILEELQVRIETK